jgi:hypothetical protein
MAVLVFALVVCVVFVGLTRLTLLFPPHEMEAVLIGLGLFVVPFLVILPSGALLWATALVGVWSLTDSARIRRLRVDAFRVPDRVPDDWRAG